MPKFIETTRYDPNDANVQNLRQTIDAELIHGVLEMRGVSSELYTAIFTDSELPFLCTNSYDDVMQKWKNA